MVVEHHFQYEVIMNNKWDKYNKQKWTRQDEFYAWSKIAMIFLIVSVEQMRVIFLLTQVLAYSHLQVLPIMRFRLMQIQILYILLQ